MEQADAATAILALLAERGEGLTICPSEAARRLHPAGWRALMPLVHDAARRLVADGAVAITQGGQVVSPDAVVGAYRIRARRAPATDTD